jgi:hypothetical protein
VKPTMTLMLACSVLAAAAEPAPPAAASPGATLSFNGTAYLHRWSSQGQNEYTPEGEEDLSAWKSMVTINVHEWARTGDQLAELANRVLGNYQATGKVLRTDSKPRTRDHEAEHFAAVILPQPTFIEAAFARVLLVEGRGVVIVYSKRFYGAAVGNEMSAWLDKNGVATEKALMAWTGTPSLAALAALPQAKPAAAAAATPPTTPPAPPAPRAGAGLAVSKSEAVVRLKSLGYPRPTDADQFVGAALQGKGGVVELFLAAGMPVDTPNRLGDHALLMSIRGGFIEVAEELLKMGADPALADENGITPLIELSRYCDETALFAAMLAKGVDVNARSRGGQTALKEATSHDCTEMVRLLNKARAVL